MPAMDNELTRIVFLDPISGRFGCASFTENRRGGVAKTEDMRRVLLAV
jgi:hypothetical protein